MKKIRVDFVAHCSVVVQVEECDDVYDKAADLAEQYVKGNAAISQEWEVENADDADEEDRVDIKG